MTPPSPSRSRSSTSTRRILRGSILLFVLAVALLAAPAARAGGDDFEFGKTLAATRYFEYARKVFNAILQDRNRSEEDRDEARYGLALLQKEEALTAAARAEVPYKDLLALFEGAARDIQTFVEKNPKNRNSAQARLDVGTVRLAFVQWARELLDDPEGLEEWGVTANQLSEDAQVAVDKAIAYFKGLRPSPTARKVEEYQELASYYYVISQYYRALVEAPCSPLAMTTLQNAGNDIEEYIMDHDGQLLAVYAQDIYGLVWWELAKCEENPEKKFEYYNKAFEWFETCIYTDDQGEDYLRVITSGFYHMAQAGLEAGRMPERNFAKYALSHLEEMLDRHPTCWHTENGLRAMVEHSKLECARGNAGKAVGVAKDAAERAKKAGKPHIERLANRQLNIYVSGGCGGSVSGMIDPDVLRRVADDLFIAGKSRDAIRAYRTVIEAAPNTDQAFLEFGWHAWERMAKAYLRLGDRLGEALAYEPIHDAWMRGVIPREKGKETDPNMIRAGNNRRSAQSAYKELFVKTGSRVLEGRKKRIAEAFLLEYKDHPSNSVGIWNSATGKWQEAIILKRKGNPGWNKALGEARKLFEKVTLNDKSVKQDAAWVYLVRCDHTDSKFADAVKTAQRAYAFWDSPGAKTQAGKFDSVRQRRDKAKGEVTYWMARSLKESGEPQKAIAALEAWHDRYPNLPSPYPELGYDLLVQANLEAGQIEGADVEYRTLLKAYPEYNRLGQITFLLAGYYNEQMKVVKDELREVTVSLNVARTGKRKAEKEALRLASLLADLKGRLKKAKQQVEWRKKALAEGKADDEINVTEGDVRAAEKEIKLLEGDRIPKTESGLKEWAPKRDKFTTEVTALSTRKLALEQELYDPMTQAAGYYKAWDDALKKAGQRRSPANVGVFAQLFWSAGRLRPGELRNWLNARALYEDFFGFKSITEKSRTDPDIVGAIGKLGDVYVNLAGLETDPAKRRELVTLAVDKLQSSLAKDPKDNWIIVGMLADEVLVMSWKDPRGKRWRFPIPRPATVKDLRDSVRNLGKEGGAPLPEFADPMEEKRYKDALRKFRQRLAEKDDKGLADFVGGGKSTFDPILYRELAHTDTEFRLALAWAYSETGREEDVPKAVNLALSLLAPPLGVEDDTPEWWRARMVQMHTYMRTAERKLTGGTGAAEATDWLDRAGKVFQGVAASYPDLGESAIPGNFKKWATMLDELNGLRGKAGMSPVDVSLSAPTAPPAQDTDGN